MIKFEYLRPDSVDDAIALLIKYGNECRLIAGGTDLMVQFHEKSEKWNNLKYLIDISHLHELHFIRETNTTVEIGALTTHSELFTSPIIRKYADFLSVAAGTVGSPQIRNLGTIGGSIGNASPAADPLTPLIALDARTNDGILIKDLYNSPSNKLIRSFIFDKPINNTFTHFEKLGRRKALAISRMNVSVMLTLDNNGKISDARICPGCVFSVPDRVSSAENLLIGKKPEQDLFTLAGKEVAAEMIRRTGVRWSTEYKEPVIEALTKRALINAIGMEVK